jgi:2-hydroxychromene-2-carboxylate isomerase
MPQDVDFFFDFISPYTYLAQTQLPALKERTGARFRLWPIHLLKLMKQVGNVPTTVICANKMKYAMQDIGRWVACYDVPLQPNPHVFNGDKSLPLRGPSSLSNRERRTYISEQFSMPSGARPWT